MATLASARTRERVRGVRVLPKGWPDFLLQLGLFAVADLLYEISRTLAKGDLAVAFVHARDVVSVERSLGIFTALALIGYVLFPTAPPRMLTDLGFIDTLEKTADVNFNTGAVSLLSNPFAAVPSVHTCFSLIIGASCFFLVRRPGVRLLWLLYPCLIVFSIVATGNHFWLDAILGACLAGVALAVAWTIERFHPTLPASARHRLRLDPAS